MATYETTLKLNKDKSDFYKKFCELNGKESAELGEHYDNMYSEVAYFDNGVRAVITMVIADYDNKNWTCGSLIDMYENELANTFGEEMHGEWYFETGTGDTYTVIVESEE